MSASDVVRSALSLALLSVFVYFPYLYVGRWMRWLWGGSPKPTAVLPVVERKSSAVFPNIVNINVGGFSFKTSLSTVRSEPNSALARMFSEEDLGLNPIVDPTTGEYFIDRDGRWFHLILEHLRDQQPDVLALRLSLQDRAAL
eukprot:EG_transcript_31096